MYLKGKIIAEWLQSLLVQKDMQKWLILIKNLKKKEWRNGPIERPRKKVAYRDDLHHFKEYRLKMSS